MMKTKMFTLLVLTFLTVTLLSLPACSREEELTPDPVLTITEPELYVIVNQGRLDVDEDRDVRAERRTKNEIWNAEEEVVVRSVFTNDHITVSWKLKPGCEATADPIETLKNCVNLRGSILPEEVGDYFRLFLRFQEGLQLKSDYYRPYGVINHPSFPNWHHLENGRLLYFDPQMDVFYYFQEDEGGRWKQTRIRILDPNSNLVLEVGYFVEVVEVE